VVEVGFEEDDGGLLEDGGGFAIDGLLTKGPRGVGPGTVKGMFVVK